MKRDAVRHAELGCSAFDLRAKAAVANDVQHRVGPRHGDAGEGAHEEQRVLDRNEVAHVQDARRTR